MTPLNRVGGLSGSGEREKKEVSFRKKSPWVSYLVRITGVIARMMMKFSRPRRPVSLV